MQHCLVETKYKIFREIGQIMCEYINVVLQFILENSVSHMFAYEMIIWLQGKTQ